VIGGAADKVKDGVLVDPSFLDFALPALDRLIVMSRHESPSQRLIV
jgi:hypothetical protein